MPARMAKSNKKQDSVSAYLTQFLERQKATGFADLAGLDVSFAVPVTQKVMDDLLAPVPFPEQVRSFRLRFGGNDLILLEVGLNLFMFKPTLRVEAQVDRHIAFPTNPVLTLNLLSGGLVEMGLNVVPLPDWITVAGRQVRLDLGKLIRDGGNGWLMSLLRDVNVYVGTGAVNITGRLAVPETAQER